DNTGSGIQVWDLATGQMLRECHDTGRQQYLGVRFSPDNKLLASYSFHSKNVYIWDAVTGTEIRRWPLALRFGECFTFSPDSTMLIVGDLRTIHFWDIASGKEVRRIDAHPEGCIYRLFLSPDARLLATQALAQEPKVGEAYQQDHQVHLWDAATGEK